MQPRRAQILDLMSDLKRVTKAAIVLITHDLGTVAGLCDKVQVMYGGRIMERGPVRSVFHDPRSATKASPCVSRAKPVPRLNAICIGAACAV